jgi:ribosome-associated toxin RatA of RatAB toxin-antitoxin module
MDVDKVFSIISDFENYPKFMENIKTVKILDSTDGESMSHWTAELDGRIFKYTERDVLKPEENRIEFELVEGDLKEYGGFWQLEKTDGGTSVTLNVHLELGIPMLAMFLNPIIQRKLQENIAQMLDDIKNASSAV